ncbi:MBL fold metallo-hydrolase [Marinobacterium arenosum]|uniref:MBL fold metallo-hydrolase n=1 Tax=Marinobacterium arenosum TaxID=2862496 RepID=UPI001C97820C|nr:MBL fold metallo-hydrolase [Marinobacterium arenosum]MBY4676552.1 MBL fold metallo-hydrolase [Marinobacterium arenosum]
MKIIFLGGTQTVTGSKYLVHSGDTRVLVDCGLFQGYKWLRERNWQPLPLDIDQLDAVVLTHAHLDHSGYIPLLYSKGYRGPVYCHPATEALCGILLPDSGHLQEEDARFYARHRLGKHAHPEPLYDRQTAERCLELFQPIRFEQPVEVGSLRFHLQPAGHILGAGSVILQGEGKTVGFSGDVGRPDDLFMHPPQPLPALDLLLLESTYGDRRHTDTDPFEQLAGVVSETVAKGGIVLIPSFAVGRAQLLQHMLATLMEQGRIPQLPVYLDSPMAIDVSDIYCRYNKYLRLNREQSRRMYQAVSYVDSVDQSKALEQLNYPHIIIAGSGMVTGGRILHHMKRLLPDHRTTVLLTGYQAGGTRGAKMLQGVESVRIHGEWVECRARVEMLDGLSGHADHLQIGQWLQGSALPDDCAIQLIHGDPDALEAQRDFLRRTTRYRVEVAGYRHILTL